MSEPEERQVPWLRVIGDGILAVCFAALFVYAEDIRELLVAGGSLLFAGLAWHGWLRWKRPELFDEDEGRDELDEQYFGIYAPKEAIWGFAAAIGVVALNVAFIVVLR